MKYGFLLFALCLCPLFGLAQSTSATISGGVTDPSGKFILDANVEIADDATGVIYSARTNGSGMYLVPILPPGHYHVQVSKSGFKTIIKADVVLNVQSALALNFTLPMGATSESVTIDAASSLINTTDASVSTVINRKFVENMPLNGRSLQSLISLAPGVVQTPIPYGSSAGNSGEFSVNGQRTESNNYTVDGVSANVGVGDQGTFSAGSAGLTPSQTALGTTQTLASIDALEEFRINTSTYSAEYGRSPGGQISLQTRSGTDLLRGSLFDYFRNDALDANNWFNDNTDPITPRTAERQNDFGGTAGGPIFIPHLYDGRHKSFFFYSYEGLRLTVPTPAETIQVPDSDLRQATAPGLQPFIDAFPIANGSSVAGADGLAYFTGAYSLPSSLDTHSIRFDQSIGAATHIFGRYSNSTSSAESRSVSNLAQLTRIQSTSRTVTAGLTHSFRSTSFNDARFNYSWNANQSSASVDSFGGASSSNLATFLPNATTPYTQFAAFLFLGSTPSVDLANINQEQTQLNLVDTQQFTFGRHSLKFGVDYRHLTSTSFANQLLAELTYATTQELQNNFADSALISTSGAVPAEPIYQNFSAFVQDEWKMTPSTVLSYGIRWDLNPSPSNGSGRTPPVLDQVKNLATAELAPAGTPEWNTYYLGFAPRLGLASQIRNKAGRETVLRIGVGNFFDTGNTLGSLGFTGLGFGSELNYPGLSLPLTSSIYMLPPASTASPYNQAVVGYNRDLKLPFTIEWNVAVEQALGTSRSLTVNYVGSAGRRLLNGQYFDPESINPVFSAGNGAYIITNSTWSNYNSLQAQFNQRLAHNLQLLASMTWSHSIDNRSTGFINYQPLLKADSDFDIRDNFQVAATYNAPTPDGGRTLRAIAGGWAFDLRAFSRTAAPVDVYGSTYVAPDGTQQYARPNIVSGVPLYVHGPSSSIPGGRKFNFAAFQAVTGTQGNEPRNFLRGFGATEFDGAIRREFGLGERAHLQLRAEAFNILNHPDFGSIYNSLTYGPDQFGLAYNTLNVAFKNQSALYEQGGPRSLQLALKILF
jgi:Carboxypeptidase regulatory-like domain/TonB-dependent Receptor Plug Domain